MTDPLLFREIETADGRAFGIATLNAPASLNSLSLTMVDLFQPQLDAWARDDRIVGVMLDAAGDKAFCAGGDLRELYQTIREHGDRPNPYAQAFFEREYRLDHAIHTFGKPFVVWGHGIVMGGGMGLMVGASHRVVTPKSRIAMPEIAIGLYPDVGGTWMLARLPGRLGLFLALTGVSINAADALHAGLADFYAPHEAKDALLSAIAASSWRGDATDHGRMSHLIEAKRGDVALPACNLVAQAEAIRALMGQDGLADIAARLQAFTTDDAWLAGAVKGFVTGSPTSAAVSHVLLERVKHLSLADVFRLELDVSLGCCALHDFAEGIRALLIEKDRNPRWQPATLAEVDDALIAQHFVKRYPGPNPLEDLGSIKPA